MQGASGKLAESFLEDHRHLTRGFDRIVKALQEDDIPRARRMAEEVNRLAGPHIEFEEAVLYPELARVRGRDYARRLYREHGQALQAIRTLLAAGEGPLPTGLKAEILHQARTGLDHAISCGTLLSHLTTLSLQEQEKILQSLLDFRRTGHRWTELAGGV